MHSVRHHRNMRCVNILIWPFVNLGKTRRFRHIGSYLLLALTCFVFVPITRCPFLRSSRHDANRNVPWRDQLLAQQSVALQTCQAWLHVMTQCYYHWPCATVYPCIREIDFWAPLLKDRACYCSMHSSCLGWDTHKYQLPRPRKSSESWDYLVMEAICDQ